MQEGFTQIQQDEDDFNTAGKRTKRKKEKRKEVGVRYEGRNALGLYVECLQVVIRRQVEWMRKAGKCKGRERELEEVVRSLWAVRLRGVKGLDDDREGYESQGGFSSTSASEGVSDAEGMKKLGTRMESRLKKLARDKGIPKLPDTVCLIYLALILMREPISFGDLNNWMKNEGFPYFGVVSQNRSTRIANSNIRPDKRHPPNNAVPPPSALPLRPLPPLRALHGPSPNPRPQHHHPIQNEVRNPIPTLKHQSPHV